jgi:hypothetical protein
MLTAARDSECAVVSIPAARFPFLWAFTVNIVLMFR